MFRKFLVIAGLASVITACAQPAPQQSALEALIVGAPQIQQVGTGQTKSCTFKYKFGRKIRVAVVLDSLYDRYGEVIGTNPTFPVCIALEGGDKIFVRGDQIAWDLFTNTNM